MFRKNSIKKIIGGAEYILSAGPNEKKNAVYMKFTKNVDGKKMTRGEFDSDGKNPHALSIFRETIRFAIDQAEKHKLKRISFIGENDGLKKLYGKIVKKRNGTIIEGYKRPDHNAYVVDVDEMRRFAGRDYIKTSSELTRYILSRM